ncbi:hypothetical protein [Paenisporosarcina sp. NPDC076898]|uniref:hypothetical protein n=1 Tax=unclassified Paenisporosarcina TaxID=2642018 RepID=UPI003D0523C5
MEKEFLKLISILIDQEPSRLIADDQEKLHDLSKRFNEALKIKRLEEKFHTEMMFDNENYLIPPVPFASTNDDGKPLAFAIMGLNPKLFLENDSTIEEKRHAGNTWEEYAVSYTTNQRNSTDIGSFYRKLTVVMESLKNGKLVKWNEIVSGCRNAQERLATYLNIVEKDPIIVGEFIPLHSSKIGSYNKATVQKLFQEIGEYKPYLTELFQIISSNLALDGWLIANGSGASAVFEIFIENDMLEGSFTKILDQRDQAYTGYVWEYNGECRKVLLLHQFLGTIGGKLNDYEDIREMVTTVINAFKAPHSVQATEIVDKHDEVEKKKKEPKRKIDNGYESFGEYAEVAEKIDQFILNGMSEPNHRLLNVKGGLAYHPEPNRSMFSFAKLCNENHPFLLLRFGKKSEGDHLGAVKQLEFDRKLKQQQHRNVNHIYEYPNEAFIYLKNLAEDESNETWNLVKENLREAYRVYYKVSEQETLEFQI